MDPQINSSLFPYIFFNRPKPNIFSFIDFLPQIFTSQGSLQRCLSNQGYYFEFHLHQQSLKPPLECRDTDLEYIQDFICSIYVLTI